MKLYKITVTISGLIFVGFFVLSALLNCFCEDCVCYNFLFSYACGISCSAILVFVTALLQYKDKKTELLNITLNKTYLLLFRLNESYRSMPSAETGVGDKKDKLSKLCFEIVQACSALEFYSEKEQKKINKMCICSVKLKKKIDDIGVNSPKNFLGILASNELAQLADNAISLKYNKCCRFDIKDEWEAIKRGGYTNE